MAVRFAGELSARNVSTSRGVGKLPVRSMLARRRNSASSHSSLGTMPSFLSFATTSSSILVGVGTLGYCVPDAVGNRTKHLSYGDAVVVEGNDVGVADALGGDDAVFVDLGD